MLHEIQWFEFRVIFTVPHYLCSEMANVLVKVYTAVKE